MVDFDSTLDDLSNKNQKLQDVYAQVTAKIELNKEKYLSSMEALKAMELDSVEQAQERIEELRSAIDSGLEKILKELE